jgi:hypothetical protein
MATEAYRLVIGAEHFGAWMENVLYFLTDNDGSISPVDMAKHLCDDWNTSVMADWLGCCPASYGVQWLEARRTSTGKGPSWVREFPGGTEVGTLGTSASTLSVAPVVKTYAATGVATQGRIFMPTPAETMLVDNVYDDDYKDAIETLVGDMRTFTVSGRTWTWGINSRKLGIITGVVEASLGPIIGNIGRRRSPR